MNPVAPELTWVCRSLAHTGDETLHAVVDEQRLERLDLVAVDCAFRHDDDLDALDLIARGDQYPVDEVEIESLRGREFEEAERILREAVHGPLERMEVGLARTRSGHGSSR